jgi:hypothetical protein
MIRKLAVGILRKHGVKLAIQRIRGEKIFVYATFLHAFFISIPVSQYPQMETVCILRIQ